MIKFVDDKDNLIEIEFIHEKDYYPYKAVTTCKIFMNCECEGYGVAICSPHDNFCRATGRKIALARALTNNFLGEQWKPFRKMIWEKYFEVRNGKKE